MKGAGFFTFVVFIGVFYLFAVVIQKVLAGNIVAPNTKAPSTGPLTTNLCGKQNCSISDVQNGTGSLLLGISALTKLGPCSCKGTTTLSFPETNPGSF